jgi:hypothetical protein
MQKWLCPALDAGFFIFRSPALSKDSAGRQESLAIYVSPSRQAPEILGHSDGLGKIRSLTTERLASPRR